MQSLSIIKIRVSPPSHNVSPTTGITEGVTIRLHLNCRYPYPDLKSCEEKVFELQLNLFDPEIQKQSNVSR